MRADESAAPSREGRRPAEVPEAADSSDDEGAQLPACGHASLEDSHYFRFGLLTSQNSSAQAWLRGKILRWAHKGLEASHAQVRAAVRGRKRDMRRQKSKLFFCVQSSEMKASRISTTTGWTRQMRCGWSDCAGVALRMQSSAARLA